MNINQYLSFSAEVKEAIKQNMPIVALESTIISHGMPYPKNVETALMAEKIVRQNGAIPATIAIINGQIKIGLSAEEINYFGKKGQAITKASKRDIPFLITNKMDGATTVAATTIIAHMANIKIFATGGIGGVHRNAETTMDISNDLEEIGRNNVAVVCAGAKSILDLPKTLEYLETKGVLVIGYQTDFFPAFYTRSSNLKVDYRLNSVKEIAELLKTKNNLGGDGGILIANPIQEEYAMDERIIDNAINEAIAEMNKLGISGKASTPYLLEKINQITQGNSLDTNIKLYHNNCQVAAQIAKAMQNE